MHTDKYQENKITYLMGENWEATLHWRLPKRFKPWEQVAPRKRGENGAATWRIDRKASGLYPDSFPFIPHVLMLN